MSKSAWSCAEQSRDGEYVCGGAAVRDQHIIRIWEARSATLALVLEGPPVGLQSVAWHPDPSRCGRKHVAANTSVPPPVLQWCRAPGSRAGTYW